MPSYMVHKHRNNFTFICIFLAVNTLYTLANNLTYYSIKSSIPGKLKVTEIIYAMLLKTTPMLLERVYWIFQLKFTIKIK
jgi:hypothetical protein